MINMYNQNKLLLRFAQEHILLFIKKVWNIFILTQTQKCARVPMPTKQYRSKSHSAKDEDAKYVTTLKLYRFFDFASNI
jgi:hypothetical protein